MARNDDNLWLLFNNNLLLLLRLVDNNLLRLNIPLPLTGQEEYRNQTE